MINIHITGAPQIHVSGAISGLGLEWLGEMLDGLSALSLRGVNSLNTDWKGLSSAAPRIHHD